MTSKILLSPIDFLVIGIYIVLLLTIGLWVSFRKKHSEDLFLAGRSLGWPNIGLSIYGTNVSPGMMIASASIAYTSGMVASNFEWLAWLFMLLLAMVFLPHYINTKISTMPEFMDRRFSDSCRVFLSGYTLFSTVVIFVGGTLFAGGLMLSQVLGWPLWVCVVLLLIIATSFTVTGGLEAVVITDSFQAILMIIASLVLTIISFIKVGGVENLMQSVPEGYWKLFRPANDAVYPWPAILLGYPVMGIWFWCTDQTMVQRLLGGRDLKQAQLGAVFAGFLKIGTPIIFFLPGIFCKVLHPNLTDPNEAYITMVINYLPVGMIGLIISVLIAALISTVDSGLNSISTVFTLDIYCRRFRPEATTKERIWVGRIATVLGGFFSFFVAMGYAAVKGMDLFSLGQSILAFLAPPLAAVFLVGVLWPRANSRGAIVTLIGGGIINVVIGVLYLSKYPNADFWQHPLCHFLLLGFYMFVIEAFLMIIVSLITEKPTADKQLPTISETYKQLGHSSKLVWSLWLVLAVIMLFLYIFFQTADGAIHEDKKLHVYHGASPVVDGMIDVGEYDDATEIDGVTDWVAQFNEVTDAEDLALKGWVKHDGESIYFAFEITDDVLYGIDTERWLPDENPEAHQLTREGYPWFGDGMEILVNAPDTYNKDEEEHVEGNSKTWQMVCNITKSRLGGIGTGGLLEGEPRSSEQAWDTYQSWIMDKSMETAVQVNEDGKGYVIEWKIKGDPCLEVKPGVFWNSGLGKTRIGLNIGLQDLDERQRGQGHFGNINHENWWSGRKDTRTMLKDFGVMVLYTESKN